ncbi:hypothetical protein DSAG12_00902 [Promethearchaeum syntrophicum]|uniref:Uncharacterized protein n=1 Tax=Promethearchaeum syntrophicum TaxID=2594042 RepID=A0A5B9D7E1_9ARCH|nr:hypothetical protein [Candidatus Prometheoarchaeum syntrophicum]QEE15079.1 hypothetical protein DSAG12_00902 [Candidatus Prometheoarchaeum syntrophicum]
MPNRNFMIWKDLNQEKHPYFQPYFHPYGFFAKHPDMKKDNDGFWRFNTLKQEIPLMFSIKARKPE